jgi:hypothetical protein
MTDDRKGGPMVRGSQGPAIGEPGYISIEQATREQLERNRAYEARPDVIDRRKREAEAAAAHEAEKLAKRKKAPPNTDYPWLKPDWKW